jgi:hypothetical protein
MLEIQILAWDRYNSKQIANINEDRKMKKGSRCPLISLLSELLEIHYAKF